SSLSGFVDKERLSDFFHQHVAAEDVLIENLDRQYAAVATDLIAAGKSGSVKALLSMLSGRLSPCREFFTPLKTTINGWWMVVLSIQCLCPFVEHWAQMW